MRRFMLFLLLVIPLRAAPPLGARVVDWTIDAAANTVTLHMVNSSGKEITAYNIKVRETYGPNVNEHELSRDTVALMFNIQELAGTDKADRLRQMYQANNGTWEAGKTRNELLHVQPGLTDFSAVIDTVIYSDKTSEATNADGLKRLLDARASFANTIQAGNAIIQKALANPNDPNPHETALKQIEGLGGNAGALRELSEDLKRVSTAAPAHGQSIREYLNDYVAKRNERAARLLEHAKAGAQ